MPKSINILSIVIIVLGVISVASGLFSLTNEQTADVYAALGYSEMQLAFAKYSGLVGGVLIVVFAAKWRAGANWARIGYVAYAVISLILSLVLLQASPLLLLPGVAIQAVVFFFLFRPVANRFFAGTPA